MRIYTSVVGDRSARSPCVDVLYGGPDLIDTCEDAWDRLSEEASNAQPFYTREWIRAYLRAFAPGARLVLVTSHAGGRLTGILPLVAARTLFCGFPVRVLRSASNVHSCRFDLLRAPGAEGDAAVAAIWRALQTLPCWDVLQFLDVPEDGALFQLLRAASQDGHPAGRWESMRTPVLSLAGGGEPWLAQTSAGFRYELRRRMRRLREAAPVELKRAVNAEPASLQVFYDLERSGWKGAAGTAIDCRPETRMFYDEIAAFTARRGWLSLYLLLAGGHPIAGQFGITWRGCCMAPKLAMDENWSAFGPGALLAEQVFRDCAARGVSSFDFIGPAADYKVRWTRQCIPHFWLWVFRKSLYGRILHSAKFALRPRLRRLFHARCYRPAGARNSRRRDEHT